MIDYDMRTNSGQSFNMPYDQILVSPKWEVKIK